MKRIYYLLTLLVLVSACAKENDFLPTPFNYEIPPVTLTEDVKVGAYYYHYSAGDWAKKITHTPMLGTYAATEGAVMAQHRQWADLGGVDFFIFNWNGAVTGDPLLNSFTAGRKDKVQMVINYNTNHLQASNSAPLRVDKLNTLVEEMKSLAATHFNQEYYYKVDGKPVVMITPLNLATSAAASIDYSVVVPALRQALQAQGVDLYLVGEITSGWLPPQRYRKAIRMMDAVDLSNWATDVYDRAYFFPSFSDQNWKNWSDSTTTWGVDYVPVILPGYNDKVMTPASKLYNIDRSADFFTSYANVAKRNMGKKRMVLINSWNNFQLGTSLEPSIEYGTTYLDLTKSQFKVKP
jgi:hypothetical protein